MGEEFARFRATFVQEAADLIGEMEEHLLVLEQAPGDQDRLDALFRCVHSLKGGSGAFGFPEMARLTHDLEERLEQCRSGRLPVDRRLVDLLLSAVDQLRGMLAGPRDEAPSSKLQAPSPEFRLYRIDFRPNPQIFERGMDPLQVLRGVAEAGELVEVTADLSGLPPLAEMDPERCCLAWTIKARAAGREELEDIFEFIREESLVQIAELPDPQPDAVSPSSSPPIGGEGRVRGEAPTLRVATEKVDRLINLVGELVISQSMVSDLASSFSPEKLPRLQEAVAQVERHTRELQERVMAVRMVPVGSLFSRFHRLVRDLAARSGKEISLQISGEETELDKAVIELMADPLTHLIRNAADHGVEPPETRTARGKPAQGVIHLSAFQEGGRIVLEVEDDGRGLDRERIVRKAVAEGLVDGAADLSDEEVWALIFRPGFSTSEEVSEVSGRGVGMDVVRKNVESLGGSISVRTRGGHGTRFTIRLPLTLAILEGQCLQVGEQVFILPLVAITESIQPRRGDVKLVVGRGEAVHLRGEFIPVLRLHSLFGIAPRSHDAAGGLLVIVESEGRKAALLVDDLLEQQQVVLKSLETNFRKVEGIAAATILGDGRVALILDVPGLIRRGRSDRSMEDRPARATSQQSTM
jgi:two-component system chemotaxis sensor kinase CheA